MEEPKSERRRSARPAAPFQAAYRAAKNIWLQNGISGLLHEKAKACAGLILIFFKWVGCALLMGVVLGGIGAAFHFLVDGANAWSKEFPWLIWFLPLGGVLIAWLYKAAQMEHDKGTDLVISSVRSTAPISIKTAPLIFVSTIITHLFGGSAGREGAALQLGGSVASQVGRWFRFDEKDARILVMCGMSAAFSALFGAPLTAAVFSLEVISVGVMYYAAIVPCTVSAITGAYIASLLGAKTTWFALAGVPELGALSLGRVILLAALCAVLSVFFCGAMSCAGRLYKRFFKNTLFRAAVGGLLVIGLTYLFGSRDYNGTGMDVIASAVNSGQAKPEAFALKLVLTAVTLGAGFRGGEIVPSFFVGATFGCVVGPLLGMDPSFAAAIGLVAMFCGVVNCPMTSLLLGLELFGNRGLLFFAVAAAVSYMLSGYHGLYKGQKILYSKTEPTFINTTPK